MILLENMLENLPVELVILDICLYAFVAAFGPLRFCDMEPFASPNWDSPPGLLIPTLSGLRRLFLGTGSGYALVGSPSAISRAELNGPAALFLSLAGWFLGFVFLVAMYGTVPFSLFSGRGFSFDFVLAIALLFQPAVLLLLSRTFIRGLLCLECLSGVGYPYNGNCQRNPCNNQKKKQHCLQETKEYFFERPDTSGFKFTWSQLLIPLMTLLTAPLLLRTRLEFKIRRISGMSGFGSKAGLFVFLAFLWITLLLVETASWILYSLGVVMIIS